MSEPLSLDALLPPEMAAKAEQIGVKKAGMAAVPMFLLAVLAGAFIALGAGFTTTAIAGATGIVSYGVVRVLAGIVFSLGLILVVVGGAELFTGNNLIVMAWASGRVSTAQVLRNWGLVYVGNFVGAMGIALLMFLAQQHEFGNGAVGRTALAIADAKLKLGFVQAVALGILCNVLVCLAVWLSFSARTTTDRILAVVPPIAAFVAAGFEHSIANMYFVPLALMIKAGATPGFWEAIGQTPGDYATLTADGFLIDNLLPVTLGNIIGGAVLVGSVYWCIYLRGGDRPRA